MGFCWTVRRFFMPKKRITITTIKCTYTVNSEIRIVKCCMYARIRISIYDTQHTTSQPLEHFNKIHEMINELLRSKWSSQLIFYIQKEKLYVYRIQWNGFQHIQSQQSDRFQFNVQNDRNASGLYLFCFNSTSYFTD